MSLPPHTTPKRRQPLTVKAVIDKHRASADLSAYPVAKMGIVLGSKVHSGRFNGTRFRPTSCGAASEGLEHEN